ncbi:MAG: DUF4215 domain-containing protein [Phycisphaerae bacterium]
MLSQARRRTSYWLAACSMICCLGPAPAHAGIVINEVDSDQPGTDGAEFVELFEITGASVSLDGMVLVLYNGNGDVSYNAFDLDGHSTNASGYFVVCGNAANVANCDLDVTPDSNLLQNQAEAVALYTGDAADFPNGTAVTTTNLIDAVVYDTGEGDDFGLLVLLNGGEPQVNEGPSGNTNSIQRCPNGSGGARNTSSYQPATPTPGATNNCASDPIGACCNAGALSCVDAQTETECGANDWTGNTLCVELDPPCFPACCITGNCYDGINPDVCTQMDGTSFAGFACSAPEVTCAAVTDVTINEIRIDQSGDDDDEYFELKSPSASTALTGLHYIVIGDSFLGASGVIEAIVDLGSQSTDATGFFVAAEDTFDLGTQDLNVGAHPALNFENENVTHLLVSGFTGVLDQDLDTDDDGILDGTMPWTGVLDCISVIEAVGSGDKVYCGAILGPDSISGFGPRHVQRCADHDGQWQIGTHFIPDGGDTPGDPNACGACCLAEGCTDDRASRDCQTDGGTYQGDASTCGTLPSPGCSFRDCCIIGVCVVNKQTLECQNQGGLVLATDTDCGDQGTQDQPCPEPPSVIISEIMYDPGSESSENRKEEWVEIYNTSAPNNECPDQTTCDPQDGTACGSQPVLCLPTTPPIDIAGWFLQDKDGRTGGFPGGTTIGPQEAVVIAPDGNEVPQTVQDWRDAWDDGSVNPALGFQILLVSDWDNEALGGPEFGLGGLSNNPDPDVEKLTVRTSSGATVDEVNWGVDPPWPLGTNSPSIRLLCTSLDRDANDQGTNWVRSLIGVNGAIHSLATPVFAAADVGSPGVVKCPDDVTGACCDELGGCFETTIVFCESIPGNFSGDDTNCEPNLCVASGTPGACCIEGRCFDGTCSAPLPPTADAIIPCNTTDASSCDVGIGGTQGTCTGPGLTPAQCAVRAGTPLGDGVLCSAITECDCPSDGPVLIISENVEGEHDTQDQFGPNNAPRYTEITNVGCRVAKLAAYSFQNYPSFTNILAAGNAEGVILGARCDNDWSSAGKPCSDNTDCTSGSCVGKPTLAPGESYVIGWQEVDPSAAEPPVCTITRAPCTPGATACNSGADGECQVRNVFLDQYGFEPDAFMGGGFATGDDPVALFLGQTAQGSNGSDAILIDIYGVIAANSQDVVWNYTNTVARRKPGALTPNPDFVDESLALEWDIGPARSEGLLIGADDAERTALLLKFTDPGRHTFDCADAATACPVIDATCPPTPPSTAATCGNGIVECSEECDDGTTNGSDKKCTTSCTRTFCGDGIVQDPNGELFTNTNEECDDGNSVDGDKCGNDCTLPVCGDGVAEGNEECDDGNSVDGDKCGNDCILPVCGDGVTEGNEECDDGNAVDGDKCGNDCTLPVCGDGVTEGNEECDDGNTANDDGCDANCLNEQAACLPPVVIGDISSRYIEIQPDASVTDPVAFHIECGIKDGDTVSNEGWVKLILTDYDDGGGVLVNIGITQNRECRYECDDGNTCDPATNECAVDGSPCVPKDPNTCDSGALGPCESTVCPTGACQLPDFLTPNQWTSNGANALYVTGLAVCPSRRATAPGGASDSRPMVTARCVDCAAPDADPVQPADPTWVYCDSSGDGQTTFFSDLFKQFQNTAAAGGPAFTGPDAGIEVDTQGNWKDVPDQQVTFFSDIFQCFGATAAGGGTTWTGPTCP